MIETIKKRIRESEEVLSRLYRSEEVVQTINKVANDCIERLSGGGKIMFMGNGGSAADSQHLATELVSRYLKERPAIPALALTVDSSALTAISNDYEFERVFSRQIEALGNERDVAIGITTSGNSTNVIKGMETANSIGILTVALTGSGGGEITQVVDHAIVVPSDNTPQIQQAHITIGHIICECIERMAH